MTQQLPPYTSPEQPAGAYPGAPVAPARGTNVMAILSIVFAFVFSPLGIIFGIVGRKQIARTGEGGRGLATAGLILSTLFLLIGIATAVVVGVVAANLPTGVPAASVAAQIEQQTNGQATGVTCPDSLPATVGASITCTGTVDGAPSQIKATATAVQGDTVSFDIEQVS